MVSAPTDWQINCGLLGTTRLTLLIPGLERKYGRWPNTEAYDWWSQWEGSVSKPFCKLSERHIDFFTSRTSFGKISLFSGFSRHPTITCETIGIWSAVTQFLPDLDDRQFAELPRSWCEPSGVRKFGGFLEISHRAERQWFETGRKRSTRENSFGERGIKLMASQQLLIFFFL